MIAILKKHWGLIFVGLILIIISLKTIDFQHYLMGWDNFSVSLNPLLNLKRTIFSTWRAYRGLGVPSDSEVTDLPRQLFFSVLNSFLPTPLLDQIYVLLCFILGVIGVYFLAYHLLNQKDKTLSRSIFATTASLFYLFNLNTVGSFFYPMPMFITRFASLPWLILCFIKAIESKRLTRKSLILFIALIFISAPSYLTATVFFTFLLILLSLIITQPTNLSKSLSLLVIFIFLNGFWLLPFLDYSIRKSPLIPQASTFAPVNENQLNESPNHFNWLNLITLYPSFLYIDNASVLDTGKPTSLHPNSALFIPQFPLNWSLFLFPTLYLIGSVFIIFKPSQKYLRWIPLVIIVSLFMIRKSYPPLGNLYDWFGQHIPYFKVVFRFGDTKFNALIALAGSLAAAYVFKLILDLLHHFPKSIRIIGIGSLISSLIFVNLNTFYLPFFKGNFISQNMFVDLPQSYAAIANIINQDPQFGRVLHLPYDSLSYWKPYSWGYFGSTFLSFMLEKPLMERTFAPASLENDRFDQQLTKLITNASLIETPEAIFTRTQAIHHLLNQAEVKYLIFDNTITSKVIDKNIAYWGDFHHEDSNTIVSNLINQSAVKVIQTFNEPTSTITLYEVVKPTTPITYTVLDSQQTNPPTLNQNTIQYQSKQASFYPFYNPNLIYQNSPQSLTSALKTQFNKSIVSTSLQTSVDHAYDIFASQTETDIQILVKHLTYPFDSPTYLSWKISFPKDKLPPPINQDLSNYASDWHILNYSHSNGLRLSLGNTVVPLPANLHYTPQKIATVVSDFTQPAVTLFGPDASKSFALDQFKYTDNPNCFQDALDGYAHNLIIKKDSLELISQNGTSCISAPIVLDVPSFYLELSGQFSLTTDSSEAIIPPQTDSQTQMMISNLVSQMPDANYFSTCLIHAESNHCLNNHHTFKAFNSTNLIIPTSRLTNKSPHIFISLPTLNHQTATLSLKNLTLTPYKAYESITLNDYPSYPPVTIEKIDSLNLPKTLSPESFYYNPLIDAYRVYNGPCTGSLSNRSTKMVNNATLLYNHNCDHGLYQILPFSDSHFYLWQVNYNLLSGKYPTAVLGDQVSYLNQTLSLNQGYPNIPSSRAWQLADPIPFNPLAVKEKLNSALTSAQFISSSVFLHPQPGFNDTQSQSYTLTQNSPNTGAVLVGDMNIIHLPQAWNYLSIEPQSTDSKLNPVIIDSIKEIIPSLWEINSSISDTNQSLLLFNQAYDEKWELYQTHNPLFVLLNIGKVKSDHLKVNGLTNGWIINSPGKYYAFYSPERLAILGWIISLFTGSLLLILPKKKRKPPSPKLATKTNSTFAGATTSLNSNKQTN